MFSAISIIELRLVVAHGFSFFVSVIRPSVGCTQLAERTLHYFRLSPRDAEKKEKVKAWPCRKREYIHIDDALTEEFERVTFIRRRSDRVLGPGSPEKCKSDCLSKNRSISERPWKLFASRRMNDLQ